MAAAAAAGHSPGSGPGDSPEGPEGEAPEHPRKAQGMLYYGFSEGEAAGRPAGPDPLDPTDLNGVHFDPEVYLDKLRRECPLDSETDMVRQIRALDSDMQTLVYENYNKFISATEMDKQSDFLHSYWWKCSHMVPN
uniref:Vacuolar protein sorting-associated protein 51 homolog n=1 Tax=Gorilla gorilla gorilla TaxID=9595 RepID=A0A2I2YJE9_GORGO